MSIIDFKMPKIKFNKMKMDVMNELEEIDYEKLQKRIQNKKEIHLMKIKQTIKQ